MIFVRTAQDENAKYEVYDNTANKVLKKLYQEDEPVDFEEAISEFDPHSNQGLIDRLKSGDDTAMKEAVLKLLGD